jgi:hypothetical protein
LTFADRFFSVYGLPDDRDVLPGLQDGAYTRAHYFVVVGTNIRTGSLPDHQSRGAGEQGE